MLGCGAFASAGGGPVAAAPNALAVPPQQLVALLSDLVGVISSCSASVLSPSMAARGHFGLKDGELRRGRLAMNLSLYGDHHRLSV